MDLKEKLATLVQHLLDSNESDERSNFNGFEVSRIRERHGEILVELSELSDGEPSGQIQVFKINIEKV